MPKWIDSVALRGLFLFGQDIVALIFSIMLVYRLRLNYQPPSILDWNVFGVVLVTVFLLYILDAYRIDRQFSPIQSVLRTFASVTIAGLFIAALVYVIQPRAGIAVVWRGNLPTSLFLFAFWACLVRYLFSWAYKKWHPKPRWLFLGRSAIADRFKILCLEEGLDADIDIYHLQPTATDELRLSIVSGKVVLTNKHNECYREFTRNIIVDVNSIGESGLNRDLISLRMRGYTVISISEFYEQNFGRVPVTELESDWLAFPDSISNSIKITNWHLKRAIDVGVAALAITIFLPIIVILLTLIIFSSKGGGLFVQNRVGIRGKVFRLYKLRTMVVGASASGPYWTVKGDTRVTRVGRILRRYRLDELPQFINVLSGDMSLVGPRPERPEIVKDLEKEIPYYGFRHVIKPGITGWAQVRFPYGASVDDARNKMEFDLYYIKHSSIFLDCFIFLKTLKVVLSSSGQ